MFHYTRRQGQRCGIIRLQGHQEVKEFTLASKQEDLQSFKKTKRKQNESNEPGLIGEPEVFPANGSVDTCIVYELIF